MIRASGCFGATARAFASASRTAVSAGRSAGRGVSSISGATTVKGSPRRSSRARRWRELEARTNTATGGEVFVFTVFFDSTRAGGYYATFASTALSIAIAKARRVEPAPQSWRENDGEPECRVDG